MTDHATATHADHPPWLAHHFDTPEQQFDTAKLGVWIFLISEILFFSGLFCAYAYYRSVHPEIFVFAHHYLDKTLGALNTCVLIFSSLTMAWAVRAAQLNQRRLLVACLGITLVCASGFLGVKAVEYQKKWREGLLWGRWFQPTEEALEHAKHVSDAPSEKGPDEETRRKLGIFFSIYFIMTGLHGLHVIGGMAVIGWVLHHAIRGRYSSQYYGPVDFTALYWHLVDLIWIFLFPLLYLIH